MKTTIPVLIVLLTLSACFPVNPEYKFKYEIIVTDTPVNLEKLNTADNDYNSDLPYPAARSEIYFSTDRNSSGDNFDIIYKVIDISYHKRDNALNFTIPENDSYSLFESSLLDLVNSENNELGPFSYFGPEGWDYFFYASDESGNFDIKLVHTPRLDWGTYNGQHRLFGPANVALANSDHNDLYPTINSDRTRMLFCSDRESNSFDIYSLSLNSEGLLHDYLTGSKTDGILKEAVLSGPSNDKCPSINGNLLVFASDREGGFGGYDLYYSRYVDDHWTTPVNFGDMINSPDNEYRPVTFAFADIDMMIFSSDRPGGKGGFDLYCVRTGDLLNGDN